MFLELLLVLKEFNFCFQLFHFFPRKIKTNRPFQEFFSIFAFVCISFGNSTASRLIYIKYFKHCQEKIFYRPICFYCISSAVRLNKYSKLNFAFYFSFKAQPSKHSSWWGRLEEDFYLRLQKTSWRRLQYLLIKTNIFVLAKHLQDVFKTSSRRFEGIFKISLRHLQDILQRCLQDASRRTIRLNCLPRSHFWEIFRSM